MFFVLASPGASAVIESPGRQDQSPSTLTNDLCPVLPDEAVDPDIHTDFSGQQVYFCCRKCLKKFEAHPEEYLARLTSFQSPTDHSQQAASEEHGEHSHEHQLGSAETPSPEAHDHSAHGISERGGVLRWVIWLGRFHPMVVHFPIALLLLAALTELLGAWSGSNNFPIAARISLWAGTLGALVAAPLGWADAVGVGDGYTGFSAKLLLLHRWSGTLTALVALLTLVACERVHRGGQGSSKLWYRIGLVLVVPLVAVTGHLGASLIYGWDYLAP